MDEIRLLESLIMEMEGFLSDAIHDLDEAIAIDKETSIAYYHGREKAFDDVIKLLKDYYQEFKAS